MSSEGEIGLLDIVEYIFSAKNKRNTIWIFTQISLSLLSRIYNAALAKQQINIKNKPVDTFVDILCALIIRLPKLM